jgi:hypothetical protein
MLSAFRCLHILGARPLIRPRKRTSAMGAIVTTDELGWDVNHQIAVAHASCTNKRSAMSFPCSAFVGASSRAEDDDDVDATKSLSRPLSVYNSNIGSSWAKCDESRRVLKRTHPAHPDQVIAVKVGTVPASGPIMRIRVSPISVSASELGEVRIRAQRDRRLRPSSSQCRTRRTMTTRTILSIIR